MVNQNDLPDSESIFGVSEDPPMCACASLSQDGIHRRGLWVVSITYCGVVPPPFLTSREPLCACEFGEVSLTLKIRSTWCLSLNLAGPGLLWYPAFMEFLSTGQNCSAWGHLSPASVSCLENIHTHSATQVYMATDLYFLLISLWFNF